jgi:hypothetical protein
MTASVTRSVSLTTTDARYVGAKVGADLRLLHNLYGRPALDSIDAYTEEVAQLLKAGYLDTVDYGFRDKPNNAWKLRLRYRATTGRQLVDSRPGKFPRSADVKGYPFYSYLTYSSAFWVLGELRRQQVKELLPITRGSGDEPTAYSGMTTGGHGYGRNGTSVLRDVYVAAS